jgi:3-oxoacyl-[acyl-carrier-protein] synthase-3
MPNTRIVATGRAVPDRIVTNDELAAMIDTTDEWIRQRTGIQQRHWAVEGDSATGFSLVATQRALAKAGMEASELDAIVYATSSSDHFAPGNGVYLQHALGIGTIPALDVRTQCSGFVYGLSIADAYIKSGMYRTVLVVGSELQSTGMDITDRGRNTAVIFADGAGAAIVQACEPEAGSEVLAWDLHSDGAYAELLWVDAPGSIYHPRNQVEHIESKGFLAMDGKEVFRHATTRMPESVEAVLAQAGKSAADLKLLIPHQANLRISEMVQKRLGLRDDQVYNNIQRYGNTTSATIPIALDECLEQGLIARGDLVAFTAFGSGFLWGSALIRY